MTPDAALIADMPATVDQDFDIVLKPISHPELGDIRIDENLFAVGRTEPPFESYSSDVVTDLSRRHARIFCEYGAVYIADLGSKNGTTVNGVNVQQKITELHDGDEVRFGRALSYRVKFGTGVKTPPPRAAKLLSLTLNPESSDVGLQPIIVTKFPFLISKADETFSRYKDAYPHQVNYISRRHAHIFLKSGAPFVEDLGSTNGTFVAGKRLDEHATPLHEGEVLAFGGHHFVYKVSLQKEEPQFDLTMTKLSPLPQAGDGGGMRGKVITPSGSGGVPTPDSSPACSRGENAGDKTTFVAAADSFLDIFCVDQALQQDEVINDEVLRQSADVEKKNGKPRARSKFAIFVSELTEAFAGNERINKARALRWGISLAALVGIFSTVLYLTGSSERDVKDLLDRGEYAQAAAIARQNLERNPDNAELKALSTEALFKANVPAWLALVTAGKFEQADTIVAGMKKLNHGNVDEQSLVSELGWIGDLEKFVTGRGGVDAPIRIYADEEKIKSLIKRWSEDTQGHQRASTAISAYVPEFKDRYAEALSHLRKLQSDDAVYLTAIERLKTTIGAELNRDHPETLSAILKEYSEKYPRIGGLENLQQDLRQYTEIESAVRDRKLGAIITFFEKARFSTPPFQTKYRTLASSSQFPNAEIIRQYKDVLKAWRDGDANQAFSDLQKMATGPWADAASNELAHKKVIWEQFTALQNARSGQKDDARRYDDRLLSFYGSLDPIEDVYFIHATESDISAFKEQAMVRAQELLKRSETSWQQYRNNGAIEGKQRLDAQISNQFRTQARLLSEAYRDAQQGMRIYAQLKVEPPAQWNKVQEEINAEAELQRKSLADLRMVLEPRLLKAKLALLDNPRNGD